MKNFIYKILGFDQALKTAFNQGYNTHKEEINQKKEDEKERKLSMNFPIGEKFMIFSNNPSMKEQNKVLVATVVNYDWMGKELVPVFKDEKTNTTFVSMGVQVRYDEEKYKIFSKLSWDEQWSVVAHNCNGLTKKEAHNLENNRPACAE